MNSEEDVLRRQIELLYRAWRTRRTNFRERRRIDEDRLGNKQCNCKTKREKNKGNSTLNHKGTNPKQNLSKFVHSKLLHLNDFRRSLILLSDADRFWDIVQKMLNIWLTCSSPWNDTKLMISCDWKYFVLPFWKPLYSFKAV